MFENTLLLSSKGRYETTASHVEAVRDRQSAPDTPREVLRQAVKRQTVERVWNERRRARRQRTAS
jgi:hypothetical protein